MASLKYSLTRGKSRGPEVVRNIMKGAERVVKETAFQIEGGTKIRAKVDTGFMMNSIYTQVFGASGYQSAITAATSRNEQATMLDEEDKPATPLEANVVVGAEYGKIIEAGGVNRPAQPFLIPAVEEQRKGFMQRLEEVVREA